MLANVSVTFAQIFARLCQKSQPFLTQPIFLTAQRWDKWHFTQLIVYIYALSAYN